MVQGLYLSSALKYLALLQAALQEHPCTATDPADPPHGLPSWLAPSPAACPWTCLMLWAAPSSSSQPCLALLAQVRGMGLWLVMPPLPVWLRAAL